MAQQHVQLDSEAIMRIATLVRKGTMKRAHSVKSLGKHVRTEMRPSFEDIIDKDGKPLKKFAGFKSTEVEIDEAFEVKYPDGHSIVLTLDELNHFNLNRDGGMIDTDTGELLETDGGLNLPIVKS